MNLKEYFVSMKLQRVTPQKTNIKTLTIEGAKPGSGLEHRSNDQA